MFFFVFQTKKKQYIYFVYAKSQFVQCSFLQAIKCKKKICAYTNTIHTDKKPKNVNELKKQLRDYYDTGDSIGIIVSFDHEFHPFTWIFYGKWIEMQEIDKIKEITKELSANFQELQGSFLMSVFLA